MPREALRFGITDGNGGCPATWKLWTDDPRERADLYLACRALGGNLETSLHASGRWHAAYSQQAFERLVRDVAPKGTDRFIQRWPRPAELSPGIVLVQRLPRRRPQQQLASARHLAT